MNALQQNPELAAGGSATGILVALLAILPQRYQPYAVIALGVVLGATTIATAIKLHGPIGKALAQGVDQTTQVLIDSHSAKIDSIAKQLEVVDQETARLGPLVDDLTHNETHSPSTDQIVSAVDQVLRQRLGPMTPVQPPPNPPPPAAA